jgi:hypothetical protein
MNRSEGAHRVIIDIPGDVWWKLASLAERRETSVASVIADGIANALTMKPPAVAPSAPSRPPKARRLSDLQQRRMRELIGQKIPAATIAVEVGCHPNTVVNWQRKIREEAAK